MGDTTHIEWTDATYANSGQRPTPTVVILAPGKWVTTNGQRTRHHYDQAATVTPWRQAAALAARGMEPIAPPVAITATIHRDAREAGEMT